MQLLLLFCYPILVHLAVYLETPALYIPAIIVLTSGVLYKGLKQKNVAEWLIFLGILVSTIICHAWNVAIYILYLPPILITSIIFSSFALSLRKGRVPLVTDIGEKSRGPLTQQMVDYTTRVTQFWALMLGLMLINTLSLTFYASPELWSLFTNVINYITIGAIFIGEFLYRRFRFKNHNHPSFTDYLKIVLNTKPNK